MIGTGFAASSSPRVLLVNFSELGRWDPNSFHDIKWYWPSSIMKPIRQVLSVRRERVDRARKGNGFSELMPITIHFDGSIEPRKVDDSNAYTMDLFWARPGDIVVSKIDLKNGAVAIIPEGWGNAVVTNHFAVYQPVLDQIEPAYFRLLIQAQFFKNHLWRNKVGAEGRKEVKLDFFEALVIPVPPRPSQQKIVECWHMAQQRRQLATRSLCDLIDEVDLLLVGQTHAFSRITSSGMLVANYSRTQQWDVKAGRAAVFISANPDFIRLGDYTEECTEALHPRENPDKEWPVYGVNNKEGVFLSANQRGEAFNVPYKRIEKGWFIHNPTRANVGSLGMVPEVPSDALTSPEYQVWRLRGGFLPGFMALMVRTDYFLSLVSFNRVGGVKQRMYYGNLAEIRLPMIDIATQERLQNRRSSILAEIQSADRMLSLRRTEVEGMILGTRPVGES